MMKKELILLRPTACALLALSLGACSGSAPEANPKANQNSAAAETEAAVNSNTTAPAASTSGGSPSDPAKYEAEISRLESEAEKSPGDDEVRIALSQAYVKRADALRDAQRYREALRDYQNALRQNPDNEEAQQRVAEVSQHVERETTGEYGEPAPLPITPDVTTREEASTPANTPPAKGKKP